MHDSANFPQKGKAETTQYFSGWIFIQGPEYFALP